jgi:ABC-type multidrug transport system ATPase subunit
MVSDLKKEKYAEFPLVVRDIRKVYPGVNGNEPKVANYSISMKVNSGELFGLLGPNGAGKTTLINQLIGMYPPTKGNAWIGGFDIRNNLEIVQL